MPRGTKLSSGRMQLPNWANLALRNLEIQKIAIPHIVTLPDLDFGWRRRRRGAPFRHRSTPAEELHHRENELHHRGRRRRRSTFEFPEAVSDSGKERLGAAALLAPDHARTRPGVRQQDRGRRGGQPRQPRARLQRRGRRLRRRQAGSTLGLQGRRRILMPVCQLSGPQNSSELVHCGKD